MNVWLELLATGIVTGGIYALVAMGLNLQYGLMRILNVAHGEFLMLGAYAAYWATVTTHASPLAFLPLIFIAFYALGLGVYRVCFRRLVETSVGSDKIEAKSLLICFGLMFILQNIALLFWGGDLRGYQYLTNPVHIGPVDLSANKVVAFGIALAASVALVVLLRTTLFGRAVRAMMQAPIGAQLVGINVRKLYPRVFGVGLGVAGLTGGLLSMLDQVSPSMGAPYTVTALIVITLGGFGSLAGSLAGGLLLGLVEAVGTYLTNPSLRIVLSYAVFVIVLIARPSGLFSR